MARIARVLAPGIPHFITQRGNRRLQTFFCDDDYRLYLRLMSEWCRICRVSVLAYCLMPNHVHMIAVPESEESLRRGIGEAHRRYSRAINAREGWTGHLWQGRFASFPMEEGYLPAAARCIEMNPVTAGVVSDPLEWPWSSARPHAEAHDDDLVTVAPLLEMAGDWRLFLSGAVRQDELDQIRKHERTGRPLGSEAFLEHLEKLLNRPLKRKKPGPKGKGGEPAVSARDGYVVGDRVFCRHVASMPPLKLALANGDGCSILHPPRGGSLLRDIF